MYHVAKEISTIRNVSQLIYRVWKMYFERESTYVSLSRYAEYFGKFDDGDKINIARRKILPQN